MTRGTLIGLTGAAIASAAVIAGLVAFSVSHGAATAPKGGALVDLDGVAAVGTGSRAVSVRLGGDPAQRYEGTTGCAARRFVVYYGGSTRRPLLVTYSATQATVAYSSNVYRFDEGPQQQSGDLVWQGDFGPGGSFSHIALAIGCPPP